MRHPPVSGSTPGAAEFRAPPYDGQPVGVQSPSYADLDQNGLGATGSALTNRLVAVLGYIHGGGFTIGGEVGADGVIRRLQGEYPGKFQGEIADLGGDLEAVLSGPPYLVVRNSHHRDLIGRPIAFGQHDAAITPLQEDALIGQNPLGTWVREVLNRQRKPILSRSVGSNGRRRGHGEGHTCHGGKSADEADEQMPANARFHLENPFKLRAATSQPDLLDRRKTPPPHG